MGLLEVVEVHENGEEKAASHIVLQSSKLARIGVQGRDDVEILVENVGDFLFETA